ncbi:hypothetical protein GFY24_30700 [Nocardia sp. SYP-A9097]|nr:hypothetical protein [Nocardia sp. SYP-A9097]
MLFMGCIHDLAAARYKYEATGVGESGAVFFRRCRSRAGEQVDVVGVHGLTQWAQPIIIRGRVVEWLDGDAGWEIVDRISRHGEFGSRTTLSGR